MSRQTQIVRNFASTAVSQARQDPAKAEEIVFSLSGGVTLTSSPPWVRRLDGVMVEVVALLGTPGSTPTTIAINRNGLPVHTITIDAGQTNNFDPNLDIFYAAATDVLTDTVITAGVGAADLTILHWF